METFMITGFSLTAGSLSTSATGASGFTSQAFNVSTVSVASTRNAAVNIYYTSPVNAVGPAGSVTFKVADAGNLVSATVTFSISINTQNRAPTANPAGPITVFQDSVSAWWNLNGTDADAVDANSLVVQLTSLPSKGTLSQRTGVISSSVTLPFTLSRPTDVQYSTSQTGSDTFSFRVVDNLGSASAQQPVSVQITAVNHAPTIAFSNVTTNEDTPVTIQFTPYDQDGDTMSIVFTSLPTNGVLTQWDGTTISSPSALTDPQFRCIYTPGLHLYGNPLTTFQFYVDDNQGKGNSKTNPITGAIKVNFVNYPPTASDVSVSVNEVVSSTSYPIQLTGSDIETPTNALTYYATSLPSAAMGILTFANGTALAVNQPISAPGQVLFWPNSYTYGSTSFTFGATDGMGVNSNNIATVSITVTHVNHAPSMTVTTPIVATRTVAYSFSLSLSDRDINDVLSVAVTALSGGGVLSFGSTVISSPQTIGTTFQITSSSAQTATFSYLAPGSATGNYYANFSFVVTDQSGAASATTTMSVNIFPNRNPTANAAYIGATQDYFSTPVSLNGTDPDPADTVLTVVIQSLPTKGTLYNANNQTITAIGPIQGSTVTYLTNQRGSDQFTFSMRDQLGGTSTPVTVPISIANTNHPPTAYWVGTASANEDTTLTITQISASDPDAGDVVSITVTVGPDPTIGTLYQYDGTTVCNAPCKVADSQYRLKFIPLADANGNTSISFTASDGMATSPTVSGGLIIVPVNDPPVARTSIVNTQENQNATFTLSVSDVDTPLSQVTVTFQSLPSGGSLVNGATGAVLKFGDTINCQTSIIFVPTTYFYGASSFSFSAYDGQLSSATVSVSINVAHVNQNPVCGLTTSNTLLVRHDNSSVTIGLTFFDPDATAFSQRFTFTATSLTVNGGFFTDATGRVLTTGSQITIASNVAASTSTTTGQTTVTYRVPADQSSTSVSLQFTVTDSAGAPSGTCSLQISSTDNQPPTASGAGPVNTAEEVDSPAYHLDGSDPDGNQGVKAFINDLPQHGVLYDALNNVAVTSANTLLSNNATSGGWIFYRPNALFFGADSFTFSVKDPVGSYSQVLTVSVSVTHVNHKPNIVVTANSVYTYEDTPVRITQVSAYDVDVGDSVWVIIDAPGPTNGTFNQTNLVAISSYPATVTDSGFDFVFIPNPNENGLPYATFQVHGYDGQASSDAHPVVTIYVYPVDDPPVAVDQTVPINEAISALNTTSITLGATDIDTTDGYISGYVVSLPDPSLGTLTLLDGTPVKVGVAIPSPRTIVWTPVPYASGSTNFTFRAADQTSLSDNIATVTINVAHVNHAPTSSPVSVVAVRGQPLTITLSATDPDKNDVFSFNAVALGGGVFTVGGSALNAAGPIATGIPNTPTRIFSTSSLTYTAPVTASGANNSWISFTVSDNAGGVSAPQMLSIDITPNSDPVATPTSITVSQDSSSSAVLTGSDADPADANTLTVTITKAPVIGTLVLTNNTGSFVINSTYLPFGPIPMGSTVTYSTFARGSDSFEFHVTDNLGANSGSVVVPITINPVNHPPTAAFNYPATTPENSNLTVTQISVADQDGDKVTVIITALPASGTLFQYDGTPITSVNTSVTDPNQWLIFMPPVNGYGIYTFSFYATDNQPLNSNSATIDANLNISFVNQPPGAVPGTVLAKENDPATTFTLTVTDVDTPLANVYVYLTSLPNLNIASLLDSQGNRVALNQPIYDRQLQLVLVTYAFGPTNFTFVANDGSLDSAPATQTIQVDHVNQPPTASANTPINVGRGKSATITINAYDPDFPESFTFSVSSYQALGGYFSYNGNKFSAISASTSFDLATNVPKLQTGTSIEVEYFAPDNEFGVNFALVNFTVSDAGGLHTDIITVDVTVLEGAAPTANPAGPISFDEESTSSVFTLGGSAPEPDKDHLQVVITTLPVSCTIVQQGTNGAPDVDITTPGTILTNPNVYLRGNPLAFGSDSFTFQVVNLVNVSSDPSIVQIHINHVNHPPTAGVNINNGTMNIKLSFSVFGQDPDNDLPLTVYISAVPAVGTLAQSDGTPITSVPTAVTDFNGKLVYYPPTNAYGYPLASFSMFVDDNSGAANSNSTVLTTGITIVQVDLAPSAYNVTTSMPQNSVLTIALLSSDPQNYPTVATILTFPVSGSLFRSDGVTAINISNPTTGADNVVVYAPPTNSYGDDSAPFATFTYRVGAAQSGLISNSASVSVYVNHTIPAPAFTGATQYTIQDNTNLTMLLTGSSAANSYSIYISRSIGSDRGVLYTKTCMAVGDEGCFNTYVPSDPASLPFPMQDPDMENILRYTPPVDKYGPAFAVFEVYVKDMVCLYLFHVCH